jgi:hypothetical protein
MSSTPSVGVGSGATVPQPILQRSEMQSASSVMAKPVGYGLPCAKCKTYYAANLTTCPVCKTGERVTAIVPRVRTVTPTHEISNDEAPALEILEAERERFLREFRAQMLSSEKSSRSGGNAGCIHTENHPNGREQAVICQSCHDHLQERIDVLEAALHIELKEATQIVYDAVWADPSDPAKTYENAAHALLSELRRRSGVTQTFGLLQPLSD